MKLFESIARLSLPEIFVLELAGWIALWLLDDYIATLLTLTLTAIVFAVLVIALVAESIDRSRVPRKYFYVMALSVAAPLIAAAFYVVMFGGKLPFLEL